MPTSTRLTIAEASQTSEARRHAQALARNLGLSESEIGKVGIAVTEAATNILKHAGQGEILIQLANAGNHAPTLQILALDRGPGIADISQALRDGYSTAGSAGHGLGAISRLADLFAIYSASGQGVALLIEFHAPRRTPPNPPFDISGIAVPMDGEEQCGDAWAFHTERDRASIFMADGLGHGLLAQSAAERAVNIFCSNHALAPVPLLETIHRGTRDTRGSAAAIAQIDLPQQTVRFSGAGNIAGLIVTPTTVRHMVSLPGIVGHDVRQFREFSYPWEPGALLILHSDGLSGRWDFSRYLGLANRPASLTAGLLWRDGNRRRDDSSIAIARQSADPQ